MKNLISRSGSLLALMAIFFVSGFINNNVALAAVDKIVFINEPQTIAPGIKSALYQIQLQDSAGNIQTAPFTIYFTLPLDLGTFTSQSGTAITPSSSVYIATGASNKYFYFVGETAGTFLMRVTATNKDKTQSWEAEQTVIINSGDTGGDTGTTTAATSTDEIATTTVTTTATTTATTTISSGGTVTYSVHYIQEDLSSYEEPTSFEISAGRERLSYVNLPISFVAKKKISADLKGGTPSYIWSFGDGSSAVTEEVTHTYKYPGEYNVVLNSHLGVLNSIARTKVKVLIPEISILQKMDGAVEIFNHGKYEINLYGWKIVSDNLIYDFPLDTIISAGKSVVFSPEYLKLGVVGKGIILTDASGKNIAQINNNEKSMTMADFQKFALIYKNLTPESKPVFMAVATSSPDLTVAVKNLESVGVEEDVPLTASVGVVSGGFWSKLFHPIQTIQNTFYR